MVTKEGKRERKVREMKESILEGSIDARLTSGKLGFIQMPNSHK